METLVHSINIAPMYGRSNDLLSGCCSGPSQKHEHCLCKASPRFCRDVCDSDAACRGYAGSLLKLGYCIFATSSTCPSHNSCVKFDVGHVAPAINRTHKCRIGEFNGCHIKQSGLSIRI